MGQTSIVSMMLAGAVLMVPDVAQAGMVTFNFSGLPIATSDDPSFHPDVSATFVIDNTAQTMELTLTYNGGNKTVQRLDQVFSALIWDFDDFTGTLSAVSATMPSGSSLVDNDPAKAASFSFGDDVSGHWAFKTGIDAGTSTLGPIGEIGVAAIGDINGGGGDDEFGPKDIINPEITDSLESNAPNGGPFTIVPVDVDLSLNGLRTQGPYIQNSVVIDFEFTGDLTTGMITNVQPFFGTNSSTLLAPEPGSLTLLGLGCMGLMAGGIRRRRRAAKSPR